MADGAKRQEMMSRAGGRRTVPQIFINGAHVGGCDDIYELDRDGELKPLLERQA
jgi:glutaredoxin 3